MMDFSCITMEARCRVSLVQTQSLRLINAWGVGTKILAENATRDIFWMIIKVFFFPLFFLICFLPKFFNFYLKIILPFLRMSEHLSNSKLPLKRRNHLYRMLCWLLPSQRQMLCLFWFQLPNLFLQPSHSHFTLFTVSCWQLFKPPRLLLYTMFSKFQRIFLYPLWLLPNFVHKFLWFQMHKMSRWLWYYINPRQLHSMYNDELSNLYLQP